MMSSGFTTHGAQAVALAFTVSVLIPMMRPNHVGTWDCAFTTTAFTPPSRRLHPGTPAMHRTWMLVVALLTVLTAFFIPGVGLNWFPMFVALAWFGSSYAAASAAESTPA